jgi:hypothetical protein
VAGNRVVYVPPSPWPCPDPCGLTRAAAGALERLVGGSPWLSGKGARSPLGSPLRGSGASQGGQNSVGRLQDPQGVSSALSRPAGALDRPSGVESSGAAEQPRQKAGWRSR